MVTSLFILAGQSNMAGRGRLEELMFTAGSTPDRMARIFMLDATLQWRAARHPVHEGIDRRKYAGVGPGLPFAEHLLELHDGAATPSINTIGIIPCAIGGTSLEEWSPDYDMLTHPITGPIDPGYLRDTEHARNMFDAMVKRTRVAVETAPGRGELMGLLWYQGENDATLTPTKASNYNERFAVWVRAMREALEAPALPVVVVAVTAVTPKLEHIRQLRGSQLSIPQHVSNCALVDALGSGLHDDGLHLRTAAQIELGRRLAHVWLALTARGAGWMSEVRVAAPLECLGREDLMQLWLWLPDHVRVAYARLSRALLEAEARKQAAHDSICKVQRDMDQLVTSLRERSEVLERLTTAATAAAAVETSPGLGLLLEASAPVSPTAPVIAEAAAAAAQPDAHVREPPCPSVSPPPAAAPSASSRRPLSCEPDADFIDRDLMQRAKVLTNKVNEMLGLQGGGGGAHGTEGPSAALVTALGQQEQLSTSHEGGHDGSALTQSEEKRAAEEGEGEEMLVGEQRQVTTIAPPPHAASNFVYGEIETLSFYHVLLSVGALSVGKPSKPSGVLYDLGSGEGKVLLAALSTGQFSKVVGLELIPSMAMRSRALLALYEELHPELAGLVDVEVWEENLFAADWSDASVVYMCSTCFSAEQMMVIAVKARRLQSGSLLLLLDKPLPSDALGVKLLMRSQQLVSWGTTGCMYVYERC